MRELTFAALLLLTGCFPFAGESRNLPGPYQLEQSEDGSTYWLHGPGERDNGGGLIDGDVTKLGWNNEVIVAYRRSTFRGDRDGWMIIDVQGQSVTGPISDAEMKGRGELRDIPVHAISEAWKKL